MPGNVVEFGFYTEQQALWDRGHRTLLLGDADTISALNSASPWGFGVVRVVLSNGDSLHSMKAPNPEPGAYVKILGSYISGDGNLVLNFHSAAGISGVGIRGSSLSSINLSEGAVIEFVATDTSTWSVLDSNASVTEVAL